MIPQVKGQKSGYTRSTIIYGYIDGNWKIVSWHSSDLPLKKK